MAYQKGDRATASDFNGFLNTVRNVYGTGNATYGYGQTAISQNTVSTGTIISGSDWLNLRAMLVVCANHQGTAITDLPPTGVFDPGDIITAHEQAAPSGNPYDLNSYVSAISSNRLVAAPGSMTLVTGAHMATILVTWSDEYNANIDVSFGSENSARYFFNSGGEIRFRFSHPNGSTKADHAMRNMFSDLGTVKFGATETTSTGDLGLSGLVGYYDLNDTYRWVLNGNNISDYPGYTGFDVGILARRLNYTGVNGGNGATIRFQVFLDSNAEVMTAGTRVILDHYRATTYLTGIVVPTFSTQKNWTKANHNAPGTTD